MALLLHGAALGLLLLVHGEADLLAGVDVEPLLEHLADAQDGVRLGGVGQPHRQLVRLPTHVHHCAVHLDAGEEKLVPVNSINVPVVYMGRDVWIWMRE